MNRGEEIGLFLIFFGIAAILVEWMQIFRVSMLSYAILAIVGGILVAWISSKIGKS